LYTEQALVFSGPATVKVCIYRQRQDLGTERARRSNGGRLPDCSLLAMPFGLRLAADNVAVAHPGVLSFV
jgi:hypothetical protein